MKKLCSICGLYKDTKYFYQLRGKLFAYCYLCSQAKSRKWYLKNKVVHNQRIAKRYRIIKKECMDLLGGKCQHCQITDIRVLCIDHKNGDGKYERLKKGFAGGTGMMLKILNKIKTGKHNYQVLCLNCNWLKALTNNEL